MMNTPSSIVQNDQSTQTLGFQHVYEAPRLPIRRRLFEQGNQIQHQDQQEVVVEIPYEPSEYDYGTVTSPGSDVLVGSPPQLIRSVNEENSTFVPSDISPWMMNDSMEEEGIEPIEQDEEARPNANPSTHAHVNTITYYDCAGVSVQMNVPPY